MKNEREIGGDWVVAKLRKELENRTKICAEELDREEARVAAEVREGARREEGRAAQQEERGNQRWADMGEGEASGDREEHDRKI